MTKIGSQNKPYRKSTQGVKCKSLCDDTKERRSFQPVTR